MSKPTPVNSKENQAGSRTTTACSYRRPTLMRPWLTLMPMLRLRQPAPTTPDTTPAPTTSHATTAANYSIGQLVGALPAGCITPTVQGTTYYLCGNTWFSAAYGANGVYYRVVPSPGG